MSLEISTLDDKVLVRGSRSMGVKKRSLMIAGHRTSVSLEQAFWDALKEIAAQDGLSLAALVAGVDAGRGEANLSSALRVFTLGRAREARRDGVAPPTNGKAGADGPNA